MFQGHQRQLPVQKPRTGQQGQTLPTSGHQQLAAYHSRPGLSGWPGSLKGGEKYWQGTLQAALSGLLLNSLLIDRQIRRSSRCHTAALSSVHADSSGYQTDACHPFLTRLIRFMNARKPCCVHAKHNIPVHDIPPKVTGQLMDTGWSLGPAHGGSGC